MEKGKLNSKMIAEYCNTAMDSSVENNIYVNKVWVQCENESCLKWRLLSSEDAAKVDRNESWYCFMNTDLRYNKCSVSEEDFPEESQLHQSGFKIDLNWHSILRPNNRYSTLRDITSILFKSYTIKFFVPF